MTSDVVDCVSYNKTYGKEISLTRFTTVVVNGICSGRVAPTNDLERTNYFASTG